MQTGTSVSPVANKLGIKSGMRALIVAAPPGYLELLSPLPDGVTVSSAPNGLHPFVQFFVTRLSEIGESAPGLLRHAAPDALVWIAYPKKTSGMQSDLSRDTVRELVEEMGWRTVSIVSIDDVWSALRFRPAQ